MVTSYGFFFSSTISFIPLSLQDRIVKSLTVSFLYIDYDPTVELFTLHGSMTLDRDILNIRMIQNARL